MVFNISYFCIIWIFQLIYYFYFIFLKQYELIGGDNMLGLELF